MQLFKNDTNDHTSDKQNQEWISLLSSSVNAFSQAEKARRGSPNYGLTPINEFKISQCASLMVKKSTLRSLQNPGNIAQDRLQ